MSEINSVSMGPQDGGAVADFDQERAEKAVKELLLAIGENPDREQDVADHADQEQQAKQVMQTFRGFGGLWILRHSGQSRCPGQRGRAAASSGSVYPRAKRSAPAQPIIAALSVHSVGGGATSGNP